MNTWELCPKCKGEKKVWKNFGSVTTTTDDFMGTIDCSICDGKGIISSITGLPPQSANKTDGFHVPVKKCEYCDGKGDFTDYSFDGNISSSYNCFTCKGTGLEVL